MHARFNFGVSTPVGMLPTSCHYLEQGRVKHLGVTKGALARSQHQRYKLFKLSFLHI